MIDPGHGGQDPGAIGPTKVRECDVALEIARRVREVSSQECLLTHEGEGQTLAARASRSELERAEAFISIHTNASTNPSAQGIESYYHHNSRVGERLAEDVHRQLVAELSPYLDRGIQRDTVRFSTGIYVLRYTPMPATLLEVHFITNPFWECQMKSREFIDRYAFAIAHGIDCFVQGVERCSNGRST